MRREIDNSKLGESKVDLEHLVVKTGITNGMDIRDVDDLVNSYKYFVINRGMDKRAFLWLSEHMKDNGVFFMISSYKFVIDILEKFVSRDGDTSNRYGGEIEYELILSYRRKREKDRKKYAEDALVYREIERTRDLVRKFEEGVYIGVDFGLSYKSIQKNSYSTKEDYIKDSKGDIKTKELTREEKTSSAIIEEILDELKDEIVKSTSNLRMPLF